MKNYELCENEVILFKGLVEVLSNWKEEKDIYKYNTELILTNINIVLITEIKKLFSSVIDKKIYKIDDVKIYDEAVQIIKRKERVDIYLLGGEVFLEFEKEKSAKEFCDKSIKLRDGNSKFVRSVKRTQKVIKETNEALDIDIVKIAKETASLACDIAVNVGDTGKGTRIISGIATALRSGKRSKKDNLLSETGLHTTENEEIIKK